jgi:hypothetical protein
MMVIVVARVAEPAEVPQPLVAETEMVPPVVVVVAVIELVVLVPVHPEGSAQLYEVAVGTAATE